MARPRYHVIRADGGQTMEGWLSVWLGVEAHGTSLGTNVLS